MVARKFQRPSFSHIATCQGSQLTINGSSYGCTEDIA